jgi:DNA-binding GntR family transcriptional regulator
MKSIPEEVMRYYYENMKALKDVDNGIEEKEDLHQLILKYVDNSLLERILNDLYTRNHRLSFLCGRDEQNLLTTKEQHLEIARRMMNQDIPAARQAMVDHINSSKDRALRYLFEQENRLNVTL